MGSSHSFSGMKDDRVPTFIAFETDAKKTSKRKRVSRTEDEPNKKKTFKRDKNANPSNEAAETPVNQVWVGAITDDNKGAFSIYFGANDERNYSEVFVKENDMQDVDYAYSLGTYKAIKVTQLPPNNSPLLIYVSSRDLTRAIRESASILHYNALISKISDLLSNRKEVQVRHISGRNAPEQQKEAINLAASTLNNSYQSFDDTEQINNSSECTSMDTTEDNVKTDSKQDSVWEKGVVKEKIRTDLAIAENEVTEELKEVTEINSPKEDTTIEKEVVEDVVNKVTTTVTSLEETINNELKETVSIDGNSQEIQEVVEEAVTLDLSEDSVVIETTVERTVETKVKVKVVESEQSMKNTEEPEVPPAPSSWFGIRNIFEVLSSPFRSRK